MSGWTNVANLLLGSGSGSLLALIKTTTNVRKQALSSRRGGWGGGTLFIPRFYLYLHLVIFILQV